VPDFKFNGKELDEENGMYYFEARYQSPPVFISRDPHYEKYPTFSPYTFCFNNPVNVIDPTGKDGEVTVNDNEKTITIKTNIILWSKSISKDKLEQYAKLYQQSIMKEWGEKNWAYTHDGTTYKVNFDVKVSVDQNAFYKHKRKFDGVNNYVEVVNNDHFRSEVRNYREGTWAKPTSSTNAAAHEFGHLLGLMDRYTDYVANQQTYSLPHKGWEHNIMGASAGKVEQRNINAIFERSSCAPFLHPINLLDAYMGVFKYRNKHFYLPGIYGE
jgi:RHS repeat-associated protein